MKKTVAPLLFTLFLMSASQVHAEIATFLQDLDREARADSGAFELKLGGQFGLPLPKIKAIIRRVDSPADAFMCLQLSQMARVHPDAVVASYQNNKRKGWGVIARQLGIQPGSSQFKTLKNGDFVFSGQPEGRGKTPGNTRYSKDQGRGSGNN